MVISLGLVAGISPSDGKEFGGLFALRLVDPPPGSPGYPPEVSFNSGTGVLTVPGGPLRLWFDIGVSLRAEPFNPQQLASWTLTLDTSPVMGGGSGEVRLASEPCVNDADCEAAFGIGARCDDPPSNPQFCTPGFQDLRRCAWSFDVAGHPAVGPPYGSFNGTTSQVGPLPDDGEVHYGGTIVLDVTTDAAGTFEPVLPALGGSMMNEKSEPIIIPELPSLTVAVPIGSCCRIQGDCVEDVTRTMCAAQSDPYYFRPGNDCPSNGGPPCQECAVHADCVDTGGACTISRCGAFGLCQHEPIPGWDPETECCNPLNGQTIPLADDNNLCTREVCQQQPPFSVQHVPIPAGEACDDSDGCKAPSSTCNAQGQCVGPESLGPGCPKSRFISFGTGDVSPSGCRVTSAIRVTFLDLEGFPAMNGESQWVGDAAFYLDNQSLGTFAGMAPLQCEPFFRDWTTSEFIHVYGAGIVPNSRYLLEFAEEGCPDLNDASCYFGELVVDTSEWGNVVYPYGGSGQPNFGDISAIVDKFRGLASAVGVVRAKLQPAVPNPGMPANFADISIDVDAFRGLPYPFAGPSACQ